jgi:hypothetical protein
MKKCKEGHYYCFQDSKCKPIPKGYRRGVGGYLRREREDEKEDSKKNGNGNGNGNNGSNGSNGNGSGNGNGVSGGNGGGNGSGGVGESVEIQNSDGETTALVTDIIGPDHMRPRLNGKGVWTGTHITEVKFGGYLGGVTINPSASRNQYGLPDNMKPEEKTKEVPLTPSQNRLLVKDPQNKIDSDVLKANPHLDPLKPLDYKKLKKLSAKVRKAHYEPEGISLTEVSLNPSQFLGALNKAKQMSRTSKLNQAMSDAGKTNGDPNLTKSDSQVTQVGDQPSVDPMIAMTPRKISKKVKKLNQKDVADYIPQLQLPDQTQSIPKKLQDEYVQEYAAAIPAITSASKFVIPALKTAAAATIFKMGKEYIKKKFRPKEEEDRAGEFWDDVPDNSKDKTPQVPNMDDKLNTPLVDKETKFGGHGKKIDAKTRRRMNAPETQFNSYDPLKEEAPTNNVGGGQIAGTVEAGDDPPVKKGRKKKKSKKKRYIYGGTGSRRMWMKKNNK